MEASGQRSSWHPSPLALSLATTPVPSPAPLPAKALLVETQIFCCCHVSFFRVLQESPGECSSFQSFKAPTWQVVGLGQLFPVSCPTFRLCYEGSAPVSPLGVSWDQCCTFIYIYAYKYLRGGWRQSQALFSSAQCKDKKLWAQTRTQRWPLAGRQHFLHSFPQICVLLFRTGIYSIHAELLPFPPDYQPASRATRVLSCLSCTQKSNTAGEGSGRQSIWEMAEWTAAVESGGDPITLSKFLKGRCSVEHVSLFSQVTSGRMWGNGLKLCQGRCRLDIKNFYMENWKRLPREVVSLVALRDMVWWWDSVGQGDNCTWWSWRLFHPRSFCDSKDLQPTHRHHNYTSCSLTTMLRAAQDTCLAPGLGSSCCCCCHKVRTTECVLHCHREEVGWGFLGQTRSSMFSEAISPTSCSRPTHQSPVTGSSCHSISTIHKLNVNSECNVHFFYGLLVCGSGWQ